jgi:hypothetical protein
MPVLHDTLKLIKGSSSLMTFSISRMIADADQNVVALNWSYSTADGTLSNQHILQKPYGETPFGDVTEGMAVEWLELQLENTSVEFAAAIAERKAAAEYEKTLEPYTPNPSGPPTPVPSPPEVADEPVAGVETDESN